MRVIQVAHHYPARDTPIALFWPPTFLHCLIPSVAATAYLISQWHDVRPETLTPTILVMACALAFAPTIFFAALYLIRFVSCRRLTRAVPKSEQAPLSPSYSLFGLPTEAKSVAAAAAHGPGQERCVSKYCGYIPMPFWILCVFVMTVCVWYEMPSVFSFWPIAFLGLVGVGVIIDLALVLTGAVVHSEVCVRQGTLEIAKVRFGRRAIVNSIDLGDTDVVVRFDRAVIGIRACSGHRPPLYIHLNGIVRRHELAALVLAAAARNNGPVRVQEGTPHG